MKMTGYSQSQITRLVNKYKKGEIRIASYQRHKFPKKYSDKEIALLTLVDNCHSRLNGQATKEY